MKVFDDGLVNDDEKVAQLPITQFTITVKNSTINIRFWTHIEFNYFKIERQK